MDAAAGRAGDPHLRTPRGSPLVRDHRPGLRADPVYPQPRPGLRTGMNYRWPAMTSLVWVSLAGMPVLIWGLLIRRGRAPAAGTWGLVGMRRRAGFIPGRRRAGCRCRPGMILAQIRLSSTDPRAGREKGFR